MSVSSNTSAISVSYYGEELPLDEALDECFRSLQDNLNSTHCVVRELAMTADQGESYSFALNKVLLVHDSIDIMNEIFKELKGVVSQVIGKPPKDEVAAMKKIVDDHKLKKKLDKERLKAEAILVKKLSASSISA